MTLHLRKLAVGITDIDEMLSLHANRANQLGGVSCAYSRNHPKRKDELLGGSLYWVIKGSFALRQEIIGFEDVPQPPDEDGNPKRPHCRILLSPNAVRVQQKPQKAFQGWRYLQQADAPVDIAERPDDFDDAMESQLNELGII